MHATIRCVTCNRIEDMAAGLVNEVFADEKEAGKVIWKEVNYQENTELAREFDVVASCIVVARSVDGQIVDFRRLDDVWTLAGKPDQFNQYVAEAIASYLNGGGL
jgi:hypothetical protein